MSRPTQQAFPISMAILLTGSCYFGIPPTPDPQQYDHDCASAGDCVAISPQTCNPGGCQCGYADAIAKSDVDRFTTDNSKVHCFHAPFYGICECAPDRRIPVCQSGQCALSAAPPDAGIDFDAGP